MRPLFVVLPHPLRTDLGHLIQRLEHIGVEYLMAERSIESFHNGVLIRLARLNIPQSHHSVRTPTRKAVGEEFRAIVEPNRLRLAPPGGDLFQDPNDPFGGQRRVHFDRQDFSDPFIQNVSRLDRAVNSTRSAFSMGKPKIAFRAVNQARQVVRSLNRGLKQVIVIYRVKDRHAVVPFNFSPSCFLAR